MIGKVEAPKITVTLELTREEAAALRHFLTYGVRDEFSDPVLQVSADLLNILEEIK